MITPLPHSAKSVLNQLNIAIHNLKHVPFQEIIDTEGVLEAYAQIGKDYVQIANALQSYIKARENNENTQPL